jgi:signal transduction histidine kinase
MRRLYLQVYLTIVGSLILVVLTAGILWHLAANVPPFGQPFETAGEVAAGLVPPASAAREAQQQAISGLSARFGTDVALFDASGERLASAGRPLPAPGPNSRPGWLSAQSGPAYSIHLPDGRWLVARIPGPRRPPALVLVGFLGAIAVAVALGALPVVRRLTRRLERLQKGVQSLGAGDLTARVEVEGRDEVAQLAKSFNQAAGRIEALVQAHKMLLANASHELRTPLTRIRLGIELAKEDPARKAELEKDIAELDRLVDEILLASRLDAVEHLDHAEEIDLLALAAEECARYDGCSTEGKPILVRGDPVLLRRMIRNLVENAERHGQQPIEVGLEARDGRALLRVCDQGPVIGQRERAGLFVPFHRVAGASGSQGTGLGLALARQIARRHGGDVVYEAERGSCFTVSLPGLGGAAADTTASVGFRPG